MAERKRLSDSGTCSENNSKKIKLSNNSNRPLCKYGAKCYRKHPDHLKAYYHPSEDTDNDDDDDEEEKKEEKSSPQPQAPSSSSSTSTISLMELAELNGDKLLSNVYQMEFPKDLYEFWTFCSNLGEENPRSIKFESFYKEKLQICFLKMH